MRLSALPSPQAARAWQDLFAHLQNPARAPLLEADAARPAGVSKGPAQRTRELVLQEYVLAFLLRHGGALRHRFFLPDGHSLSGYLWEEPIRSRFQLVIGQASLNLLAALEEVARSRDASESARAAARLEDIVPLENGDLLLVHALVMQALRGAGGRRSALGSVLRRAASPLSPFAAFDALEASAHQARAAAALLADPILLPVLGSHLAREWTEIENLKDRQSSLPQVEIVNQRQAGAWRLLWDLLIEAGRVEGLLLFVRFLVWRWRAQGGLHPLLERIRQRSRGLSRQQEREALDHSWGELFRFGADLEEWAAYLRGRSWADLTEAERAFLGEYARDYERIAPEVRRLQRELCREI